MPKVSISEVSDRLSYNPETGELRWVISGPAWFKDARAQKIWNTRYAGKLAATKRKDGRLVISFRGEKVFAHRVAFAIHHGFWPIGEVDHINGDASDNSAGNLRDVTKYENMRNQKRSVANKSGVTGVVSLGRKWGAFIGVDGGQQWLGSYKCKEKAVAARKEAEQRVGYHRNHGRPSA